jgi:hypothetical protein
VSIVKFMTCAISANSNRATKHATSRHTSSKSLTKELNLLADVNTLSAWYRWAFVAFAIVVYCRDWLVLIRGLVF